MNPTDTISETTNRKTQRNSVSILFDGQLESVLMRLVFWSKLVGFTSVITGSLLFLGIIALIIPAVVAGTILIVMGVKLLAAGVQFRQAVRNRSFSSLQEGLSKLRSYIILNGLLLVFSTVLLLMLAVGIFVFGDWLMNLWDETTNTFVLALPLKHR